MNLIICCTPLQVLIAEKIIDLYPNEIFYGIVLAPVDNDKYRYYGERLKQKCQKYDCYHVVVLSKKTIINYIKYIIDLLFIKFKFRSYYINKIFCSNINDYIITDLIQRNPNAYLYTFDDGTANIMKDSFFYQDIQSKKRKLFLKIFGIHLSLSNVKNRIIQHYTIFPNLENISPNIVPIALFETKKQINPSKHIHILLGQPIFSDSKSNIHLVKQVIKNHPIDCYFPHPREIDAIEGVDYIKSPLIFEDYVIQHLQDYQITVYTFFSTVAINLMNNPNINVISIYHPDIISEMPAASTCYQLFERLGVKIVEVPHE